jgi:hypothetical protein
MGINVVYSPDANTLAAAAYQGGLGEYRQRQAELGLRQQAMQQDWAQQQQQLAAHLFAQQQNQLANQNSQLFHAAVGQDWRDQARQADVQDMAQRRTWAEQDMQQRREFETQDQASQQMHDMARIREQAGLQWRAKSAEEVDGQMTASMANLSKQRANMTPEGQRLLGDLYGKLRAIQKQRGVLPPEKYTYAMGHFWQELSKSGIEAHINTPKPLSQQVQENTYQQQMHAPDGTFLGTTIWSSVVRNGSTQLVPKFIPHKPDPETKGTTPTAAGFQEFVKANKAALTSEETGKIDYEAAQRQYIESVKAAKQVATMTVDDAAKEMQKQQDEQHQAAPGVQPQPQSGPALPATHPNAGLGSEQKNELAQLPSGTTFADTLPINGAQSYVWSVPNVGFVTRQGSRWMIVDHDTNGNMVDVGTYQPAVKQSQSPASPQQAATSQTKPTGVPKHKAEVIQALLPKPKTPQEAMALPPGTRFLGPDGKVRTVPMPE